MAPNLTFQADTPITALAKAPASSQAVLAGRGCLKVVTVKADKITLDTDLISIGSGSAAVVSASSAGTPADDERLAYVSDVKWSSFAQTIAVASTNGVILLYAADKPGVRPEKLVAHSRTVNTLAINSFAPHMLVSGGQDCTIRYWDLRSSRNRPVASIRGPDATRRVQFSAIDGTKCCAIFDSGALLRYDSRNISMPDRRINAHTGPAFTLDCHPSRDVVATGGRDRTIRVWDLSAMQEPTSASKEQLQAQSSPLYTIPTPGAVSNVLWRPGSTSRSLDDSYLACSFLSVGDYRIQVWNLRRRFIPAFVISHHTSPVTGIVWPSGTGPFGSDSQDNVSDPSSEGSTIWAASRDQSFVAHDLIQSCPVRPTSGLSHQAFAWAPNDSFTFASIDRSKLRPDGLIPSTSIASMAQSATMTPGASIMMKMMLRHRSSTQAVPVIPAQFVGTGSLTALSETSPLDPRSASI
ncbi:WD40-repeat-containing domain protein [Dipodascopsis uninucleata]